MMGQLRAGGHELTPKPDATGFSRSRIRFYAYSPGHTQGMTVFAVVGEPTQHASSR